MAKFKALTPQIHLVIVLGIALALRLFMGFQLVHSSPSTFATYDWSEYEDIGRNMLAGAGMSFRDFQEFEPETYYPPELKDQHQIRPQAYRVPVLSCVAAASLWLFGEDGHFRHYPLAAFIALCSTMIGYQLYRLSHLFFSASISFWIAVIYLFYPASIYLGTRMNSEVPSLVLLLIGMVYLVRATQSNAPWKEAAKAGLWFGLSILTRPNPLILVPLCTWWLFLFARPRLLTCLCFVSVLLMILMPWLIRNYRVTGHFTFTTYSGIQFRIGNCEETYAFYSQWPKADMNNYNNLILTKVIPEGFRSMSNWPEVTPYQADKEWYGLGRKFAREDKHRWLRLLFFKVLHTWRPFVQPSVHSEKEFWLSLLTSTPLIVLGFFGTFRLRHDYLKLCILLLLIYLGGTFLGAWFHPTTRYRFSSIDVFIIIPFAWYIHDLWEQRLKFRWFIRKRP